MYRKAISLLLLGNMLLVAGFLCVEGVDKLKLTVRPVSILQLGLEEVEEIAQAMEQDTEARYVAYRSEGFPSAYGIGIMGVAVSDQRVLGYELVEQELAYELSDEELEVLLRIVEAEAGSEDEDGRLLVANVVLNRVTSDRFPSTVTEVVFQKENGVTQFSPVSSGTYYKVQISEGTIAAVNRALRGEDISQGALFFASRKKADSGNMRWFDKSLTFLFEHGGHEFFK